MLQFLCPRCDKYFYETAFWRHMALVHPSEERLRHACPTCGKRFPQLGKLRQHSLVHLADEEKPALMIDFATLTGAARVALGPELPAMFTDDDALAADMAKIGMAENDPVWRLPLWKPYEALLDSKVSDTNNVSTGGQGGAITAALFLRKFVTAPSWLHFDIFAWTISARPGRPEGAECQTARALYALLCARYS